MIYLVTRRRGQGLAAEMKNTHFPVYRIVAGSAAEAKKIACRMDRQGEYFSDLYMATPEATKKKRRTVATDRRPEKLTAINSTMKTDEIITHNRKKRKRGVGG